MKCKTCRGRGRMPNPNDLPGTETCPTCNGARHVPSEYRVRWEVDVDATSPLEAAQKARSLQLAPSSTARVFDVWPTGSPSKARRIDLDARTPQAIEPSDVLSDLVEAFPGLIDGETEVNGADLVQRLSEQLRDMTGLDDFISEARRRELRDE